MKMTTLRKAIVGALALSAGTAVTAAPLGEHVNGFYNDAAGETRRGLAELGMRPPRNRHSCRT